MEYDVPSIIALWPWIEVGLQHLAWEKRMKRGLRSFWHLPYKMHLKQVQNTSALVLNVSMGGVSPWMTLDPIWYVMGFVPLTQNGYGIVSHYMVIQQHLNLRQFTYKAEIEWKTWYVILGHRVFRIFKLIFMMISKQMCRRHCMLDAKPLLGYQLC